MASIRFQTVNTSGQGLTVTNIDGNYTYLQSYVELGDLTLPENDQSLLMMTQPFSSSPTNASYSTAWNFLASTVTFGDVYLFGTHNSSVNPTVYLDSMSPFISVNVASYAYLIDTLQVDNGKYWQCQDHITLQNYNDTDPMDVDTSDWWASCYSQYNCSVWDLLPTFNITPFAGVGDDLMMTSYSFL